MLLYLQQRLLNENQGTKQTIFPTSRAGVGLSKTSTSAETKETSEAVIPLSSPKLTASLFTKKTKSQEGTKFGIKKIEQNQTLLPDGGKEDRAKNCREGEKDRGNVSSTFRSSIAFMKSSDKQEVKRGEEKQVEAHRPSNPFLKSSIR
jgi:hypothetical protein